MLTRFFNILKDSIQDGEEGDMWLAKSAGVNVQARYKRDDSLEDKNPFRSFSNSR